MVAAGSQEPANGEELARQLHQRQRAIVCIQATARGQRGRVLAAQALAVVRRRPEAAHIIQCAYNHWALQRRLCVRDFVKCSLESSARLLSWSKAVEAAVDDDATRRAERQLQARREQN